MFTEEYNSFCPGSILIISSAFFVYTQKVKDTPNEGHTEDKGKVKQVGKQVEGRCSLSKEHKRRPGVPHVCNRLGTPRSPNSAYQFQLEHSFCLMLLSVPGKVVSIIPENTGYANSTLHNALRRKMTKPLWKVLVSIVNTLKKSTKPSMSKSGLAHHLTLVKQMLSLKQSEGFTADGNNL